jgi:hypothetical protein
MCVLCYCVLVTKKPLAKKKPVTHFEQVPVAVVVKIVKLETPRQKQAGGHRTL